VLLRIEDHDRTRSRPEFEAGILDDLDWLGYVADIFSTHAYRAGSCEGRQSERDPVYREAFEILRAQGLVYACDCSRRSLESKAGAGFSRTGGSELPYAGHCRERRLPLTEGYGWRARMEPGVEIFEDQLLGHQRQDPSRQCGDLLVRDRHGHWSYQFAVTVDDWRQGIDHVMRGTDLLASTGRQIRLARLLGRDRPPVFAHHPLIMKSPNQKLSKSDGDTGVSELRRRGWTPEEVKEEARK